MGVQFGRSRAKYITIQREEVALTDIDLNYLPARLLSMNRMKVLAGPNSTGSGLVFDCLAVILQDGASFKASVGYVRPREP